MRRRSWAWLSNRRPDLAPWLRSLVGSMTRMRTAWMSSFVYLPASPPWLTQLSEAPFSDVLNGSRPSKPSRDAVLPAHVDVTLPGGTTPLGYVSRLYRLELPT